MNSVARHGACVAAWDGCVRVLEAAHEGCVHFRGGVCLGSIALGFYTCIGTLFARPSISPGLVRLRLPALSIVLVLSYVSPWPQLNSACDSKSMPKTGRDAGGIETDAPSRQSDYIRSSLSACETTS